MKSLSLNRPLILMVIGLPGAGKSFFARQFAETFNVAHVSGDRLRAELFAAPQFTREESDIISRLQYYIIGELGKTKRSFIVDGNCNARVERQRIAEIAKQHSYGTLTIWVQTDPATARLRSTKRNPNKPDDALNPSLSFDQFDMLTKRFSSPAREDYVVISGKHVYSTQARMVLRKLATPHTEAAERVHRQEQGKSPRAHNPSARGIVIR